MRRKTKIIACILLIFLLFSMSAYADSKKSAVPGYLLGILLGFGSGHFYFGDPSASLFLITEIAGTATIIAGGIVMLAMVNPLDPYSALSAATTGYIIMGIGALALEIFHVIEIIDIFRAASAAKKAGRVAENSLDLEIQPTGFSVRYRFQ